MCNERFILFSTIFKQLVQTLNIPIAVECQVKQVIYTVMPLLSAKLAKTAPRIATTKLVMQITDFTLAASAHYYRKLPGKQKRVRNCLPLQYSVSKLCYHHDLTLKTLGEQRQVLKSSQSFQNSTGF